MVQHEDHLNQWVTLDLHQSIIFVQQIFKTVYIKFIPFKYLHLQLVTYINQWIQ